MTLKNWIKCTKGVQSTNYTYLKIIKYFLIFQEYSY
jgi:hypothetical protein